MNKTVTRQILFSALLILIFLITGCVEQTPEQTVDETIDWREFELTNIGTGDTFKISDFKGKPVLLESFAVWCPTCLQQQRQISELKKSEGDAIIHISLDTDPDEDAEKVKNYLNDHGFDWYFAISPPELTRALIDEFDFRIVDATGAPVAIICEDQSTRLLGRGVKSADKLRSEIDAGC